MKRSNINKLELNVGDDEGAHSNVELAESRIDPSLVITEAVPKYEGGGNNGYN